MAVITLLIVTGFLRYSLYLNSQQLSKEFLTQNAQEIYSIDTLKLSSRLNSFSRALNWVCISGEVNSVPFFHMQKGQCNSGVFQQKVIISVPEANNIQISLTLKLSKDLEVLFIIFLLMQIALILSLVVATKKSEEDKRLHESKLLQLSRKMFHDIRSPLASLNTVAESIKFNTNNEEIIFKNSIIRINDIANSLLSETKKEIIQLPSYQPLATLINEIIIEKKNEYKDRNVSLMLNSTTDAKAFFEPMELKRILSNLINNSIEAADDKIQIQINSYLNDHKLTVDIIDNGKGIPQKILSRLGKEEVSTKKKGSGLGIKEASDSLTEWGASLEILETSSKGTTIRLNFETKVEIKKYYLVDDDDLVRMTWEMKAKKNGISLKTFATSEALMSEKENISKDSHIYIDSELGNIKDEDVALELHNLGFQNISITSGHPPEKFVKFDFLKSVISKSAPF